MNKDISFPSLHDCDIYLRVHNFLTTHNIINTNDMNTNILFELTELSNEQKYTEIINNRLIEICSKIISNLSYYDIGTSLWRNKQYHESANIVKIFIIYSLKNNLNILDLKNIIPYDTIYISVYHHHPITSIHLQPMCICCFTDIQSDFYKINCDLNQLKTIGICILDDQHILPNNFSRAFHIDCLHKMLNKHIPSCIIFLGKPYFNRKCNKLFLLSQYLCNNDIINVIASFYFDIVDNI